MLENLLKRENLEISPPELEEWLKAWRVDVVCYPGHLSKQFQIDFKKSVELLRALCKPPHQWFTIVSFPEVAGEPYPSYWRYGLHLKPKLDLLNELEEDLPDFDYGQTVQMLLGFKKV